MIEEIHNLAPGFDHLSHEEIEALQCFTLTWTLFEAQILDNQASVNKITEVVERIDAKRLEDDWFRNQLNYFTDRYIENGETNYRFDQLHLRKNDNPDLVREVLTGRIDERHQQLIACLSIVYRFRNNFFHGLKWAYGLQEQLDNFFHSSVLLQEFMKRYQNDI